MLLLSSLAVVDGRVHVLGGRDLGGETLRSALRYDPAGDAWEEVAPMYSERAYSAAVGLVWARS